MHLRQLKYLRLVVEKGSFALAAKEAGVSQPAITMAMQSLEREWDVVLFEKSGRQKVPTEAALSAAKRAADLHGQLEALAKPVWKTDEWNSGREAAVLKVGMAPAAALLYAPTIEREWRRHEPSGLLRISAGSATELLAALQTKELDIVVTPRPRQYQPAGTKRLALHTSTPKVYARKGHPLAATTSLSNVVEAGWGVAGHAGTAGNVIEEAHRVRGLPAPRILVQCADYATLLNLVAHTDLLCVVPHAELVLESSKGAIAALQIREGLPQYEVCLFWASGKQVQHARALASIVGALEKLVA